MPDKATLLAALTRHVADRTLLDRPLSFRLCIATVRLLGGHGGAITLAYTELERTTICTTDPVAEQIEQLQDVYTTGPSVTAYRTGQPATLDLAAGRTDDGRWEPFVQAARDAIGPALVRALPMRTEVGTLGVLTFYRRGGWPIARGGSADDDTLPTVIRTGMLNDVRVADDDLDEALFLSDAVGAALLAEHPAGTVENTPWSTRARVHQATGMVVAQLGVTPSDSLALLRAHAYAHGASLDEIAEQVLERDLTFVRHDGIQSE